MKVVVVRHEEHREVLTHVASISLEYSMAHKGVLVHCRHSNTPNPDIYHLPEPIALEHGQQIVISKDD